MTLLTYQAWQWRRSWRGRQLEQRFGPRMSEKKRISVEVVAWDAGVPQDSMHGKGRGRAWQASLTAIVLLPEVSSESHSSPLLSSTKFSPSILALVLPRSTCSSHIFSPLPSTSTPCQLLRWGEDPCRKGD